MNVGSSLSIASPSLPITRRNPVSAPGVDSDRAQPQSRRSGDIPAERQSEPVSATSPRISREEMQTAELRPVVIEARPNPAAQAFLDVARDKSEFRLIDIYV